MLMFEPATETVPDRLAPDVDGNMESSEDTGLPPLLQLLARRVNDKSNINEKDLIFILVSLVLNFYGNAPLF